MASDYETITADNIKALGTDTGSRKSQIALYSEPTHFIYELLQNADDYKATEVSFTLTKEQLIIEHNGTPFTEENVKAISYFEEGTSASDETKTGRFGLGFKSVFNYTATPQIYSGNENFEIYELYKLKESEKSQELAEDKTRIILPFNQEVKKPDFVNEIKKSEDAYNEISTKLQDIGLTTLLFTQHIKEIKWSCIDKKGHYLRERNGDKTTVVTDNASESYIVFSKEVEYEEKKLKPISIAWKYDKEVNFLEPSKNNLFVLFETQLETHLGFIVDGPFATNPSRESIKYENKLNTYLISELANLLEESLSTLKDKNLLNIDFFKCLPIKKDYSINWAFNPLFDRVKDILREQEFLPTSDGLFTAGNNAKLARGKDLIEIFSPELLSKLFNKENLVWLDASITQDSTRDLYDYLIGSRKTQWPSEWEIKPLIADIEVRPENIAKKLTKQFFKEQSIEWLIKYIEYIEGGVNILKKDIPFIRLENGEQVVLPEDNKSERTAWFAPKETNDLSLDKFPVVHSRLSENNKIREFLEKEGIRELDSIAIVQKEIIPCYPEATDKHNWPAQYTPSYSDENAKTNKKFDEQEYYSHLNIICNAYKNSNEEQEGELKESLNKVRWIACVNANGKQQAVIKWKTNRKLNLFESTETFKCWFSELDTVTAYFTHSSIDEVLNDVASKLIERKNTLWMSHDQWKNQNEGKISWRHGDYARTKNYFHPKATIYGLEEVLDNLNLERAKIVWETLLEKPYLICGEVERGSRAGKLKKSKEFSKAGRLLLEKNWLPNKEGEFHNPKDLFLCDLPLEFEKDSTRAKEVANNLKMQTDEKAKAIDELSGGNEEQKKAHEAIANDPSMAEMVNKLTEKKDKSNLPSTPAPSFKEGIQEMPRTQKGRNQNNEEGSLYPPQNPARYQEKSDEKIKGEVEQHLKSSIKNSFSIVKNTSNTQEVRDFLYQEYKGKCQITQYTFQKASANSDDIATNYFEACSLLSHSNAEYLNDAGNMLCVSADACAKLKHANFDWIDNLEDKIKEFKGGAEYIELKIKLASEECAIRWSQRHFMKLIALYNHT
jgi:hypothetical protein